MILPALLAFDLPPALSANAGWIVAALIVVVGLLVVGLSDLLRFRMRRVLAIAGVCFDESIRRRILWITPLAILGVIVVSSLQKPFDEQDAIRQITKFCIFATGLVVVIATLILACTNLPREIENRVIFTVVTKPITRLEIVLGKIIGFSYVSAAILVIMGLFTWGYLHVRAYTLEHDIAERLETNAVEPSVRPALEHYRSAGLLNAKTLTSPTAMQILGRLPVPGDPHRYFMGDNSVMIPFELPPNAAAVVNAAQTDAAKIPGMIIHVRVGYLGKAAAAPASGKLALTGPAPLIASTQTAAATTDGPPTIQLGVFDPNGNSVLLTEINGGRSFTLTDPNGTDINAPVTATYVASLQQKYPYFYVVLLNGSGTNTYWVDDHPAQLIVPLADKPEPAVLVPALPPVSPEFATSVNATIQAAAVTGSPIGFTGRQGLYGQQQLRGGVGNASSVCIYQFRNLRPHTDGRTQVPVEMRFGIERGGDDPTDAEIPTHVTLAVRDPATGRLSDPVAFSPENNRTAYASIPADMLTTGNFDLVLRCLTPQHWIGLTTTSLSVVEAENSFVLNLVKSLLILWLLTVLVISIAIFSSTFLSWPIAVVLTLVILLGRWGVEEVGDAATAGLGRQFVQDFGVRDPAQAQALSTTVEELNKLLNTVAVVLPDIQQFSATDNIERGVSIPPVQLVSALAVALGFGLPLTVLAYVFLKNKEVAP
jgi:hypothetical protein